ncbi:MAG: hypothetical protein PHI16_03955 [Methanocellales archaeon]|nr:hypothetical protein [Methanocellales archaeon]
MSSAEEIEKLKATPEPTDPDAIIPWCTLGYTVKESKEKCPFGGCWKYRCFDSKLNASWHADKEAHYAKRFG